MLMAASSPFRRIISVSDTMVVWSCPRVGRI
jgi:hypothetical protein